jgi:hypothetical protein
MQFYDHFGLLGRAVKHFRDYLATLCKKCETPVFTGSRRFRNDLYFLEIVSAFLKRFRRCFRACKGAGEILKVPESFRNF